MHYDVIIVGGGIAGAGLAYNLRKSGFSGSVLVIDRKKIGFNVGYGYRNTFPRIVEEYELPYHHVYDGLRIGTHKKIIAEMDQTFYFVEYQKICEHLLDKSNYEFRQEAALSLSKNSVITSKEKYSFSYLVDCSGGSSFARKKMGLSVPKSFWVGDVKVLKEDPILTKRYHKGNYFYFLPEVEGNIEDIYFLEDKIVNGHWKYVHSVAELNLSHSDPFLNKDVNEDNLIKRNKVILPANPVLPLFKGNVAFLGDSFGNATPSAGEGVRLILDASKLLSKAILKKDLKQYEKTWKNTYFNDFVKMLAVKQDMKGRMLLLEALKDRPDIILKLIKNDKVSIPKKYTNSIPLITKMNIIKHFFKIKFYYALGRL